MPNRKIQVGRPAAIAQTRCPCISCGVPGTGGKTTRRPENPSSSRRHWHGLLHTLPPPCGRVYLPQREATAPNQAVPSEGCNILGRRQPSARSQMMLHWSTSGQPSQQRFQSQTKRMEHEAALLTMKKMASSHAPFRHWHDACTTS